MNKPHTQGMTKSAREFLTLRLGQRVWLPGTRLPTIRQLAQQTGISKSTMARAIKDLGEKGLLDGFKKYHASAEAQSSWNSLHGETRSQRVRMLFEKDILSGAFGLQGNLPSTKELQSRYEVGFRTMRKILHTLQTEGALRASGRGYSLPAIQVRSNRQIIVFITCKGYLAQTSALNHAHNKIVNLFESECLRLGLRVEIVEIDFYDSVQSRRALAKLADSNRITGFVLDVWWDNPANFQRSYHDALARTASFRKPVAILDEFGRFDLPVQFGANPKLQVYRIEGRRAGERMARYILGLGHRSVAYISFNHDAQWSQDRFDGITSQFSRGGCEDGVHLIAGNLPDALLHQFALSGLHENEIKRLISLGRTSSQAEDLRKRWTEFLKAHTARLTGDSRTIARLQKNLAGLRAILAQNLDDEFLAKTCDAFLNVAGSRTIDIAMRPLFEKALADSNITAWICANDTVALLALSFLRECKIRVPGDVSVAGFDNVPVQALENRLTTFDFNAIGFVHQMLNFIVRPPRPRGHYRHSAIDIEGIVLERGTTGPAAPARVLL
jgi:DNA-binding LacI/PurR family transcriptional regulator